MVEAQFASFLSSETKDSVLFRDPICAVIAEPSADAMLARIRAVIRGRSRKFRTIELRLDWLSSGRELERLLKLLPRALATHGKRAGTRLCVIATLRRRVAGGRFAGGINAEVAGLVAAAKSGCTWCDLEIESAERLGAAGIRELRNAGARILMSFHDFRRTPPDLAGIVRRLKRCRGDASKIATQCRTLGDSVRVLRAGRGRRNVVAVPMGDAGLPARILALREGSAIAYAALERATAPGQLSVAEMRERYRADRIGEKTRVYGVIGDPVVHSLSPVLHNAAYVSRGMDAVYLPIPVRDVRDFVAVIPELRLKGFSVTLPHKESVLRYLSECDPLAAKIGAANTVVVRGGRLFGYNTDYVGVLSALASRITLAGARVLLLGAGGAARAASFALAESGANVAICARRPVQAKQLALAVGGEAIPRESVRTEYFAAIINATPLGWSHVGGSPLDGGEMHCDVAMDMVYRPIETRFLRIAAQRGIATVSGVEMFLAQAAAQWEIWFGNRAPVGVMRRAVLAALKQEKGGA